MKTTATQNRRPLRWTHTSPEGYHIYTFTCGGCDWHIAAARLKRNHWTLDSSDYTEDSLLSSDWNDRSYESYTALQNEAQRRIEDHCRRCEHWTTIYTRPQPTTA